MKMNIKILLVLLLTFAHILVNAQQRPVINSIDPRIANVGETITITGTGFPTNVANVTVSFGAVTATVVSTSTNVIRVTVPAEATLTPITVTNTSTGLSSTSSQLFMLSFGGAFNNSLFSAVTNTTSNQRLAFDLCVCDFDGDGKPDMAMTSREPASSGTTSRLVYRNTSTSSISWAAPISLGSGIPSNHINCADLDGDGRPDLVVTQNNNPIGPNQIEIYRNTSTSGTISFASAITITPPRDASNNLRAPFMIEIADVNIDGKPDLIISTNRDEFIDIYLNNSSVNTININSTPVQVNIPTGSGLLAQSIKMADLNADGLPDLLVAAFERNQLFVFENNSTTSAVKFKDPQSMIASGQFDLRNIEVADLDGDGKNDVMVTDRNQAASTGRLLIFPNTSTVGGAITFGTRVQFNTLGNEPFGLSTGDVDGDGRPDIVVAITELGFNNVELYRNTSTGIGNFGFTQHLRQTTVNNRQIKIVDLNGDAKPDYVFTSNSVAGSVATFSTIQNNQCMRPVITPANGIFCPTVVGGGSFILTATPGEGVTYQWEVREGTGSFVTVTGNSTNQLDISAYNSDLQVRVTANIGACAEVSTTTSYTRNNTTPANPTITGSATYCAGETITLTSSVTANIYNWTGPNGFSQSGSSNSITIPNSTASNTGTYRLTVQATGGCLSQAATREVVVVAPPNPVISNSGDDAFCAGTQVTLSVASFPGFTYQWRRDGTNLGTSTTQTANVSGNYTVTITDPGSSCSRTSIAYALQRVDAPIAEITAASEICIDVPLAISAATTNLTSPFTVNYNWSFLDASNASVGTGTGASVNNTFTASGNYTLRVTVAYNEITGCSGTFNRPVTVSPIPTNITISAPTTEKCPIDSILLTLPANLASYNWSNGATTNSIYAKTAPNQNSVTINVSAVTTIGCTITDQITISNFANSGIFITSPIGNITNDQLLIPRGVNVVELVGNNGSNFQWQPASIFENPTGSPVLARPRNVQTLVTLTGTDINDCGASAEVTLVNENVLGRKSFSPNGDGLGFDCWEITNASNLNGCEVIIFDKRGRNVFTSKSPFTSDCIWDGNINNSPAPSGIYYYVMKCSDAGLNQSGSILLAR